MFEGWLSGWKEIARYIGRSVRTTKRYYYLYSMPVHRVPPGSVHAIPFELDKWMIIFDEKLQKYRRNRKNQAKSVRYR